MNPREKFAPPDPRIIAANLARIRGQVDAAGARAGRDPQKIEILVATKYVDAAGMEPLAAAGVTLVGENRAQDLLTKHDRFGERFTWDFIGHLQSNKVRQVLPLVRVIHAIDSLSVVQAITRHMSSPPLASGQPVRSSPEASPGSSHDRIPEASPGICPGPPPQPPGPLFIPAFPELLLQVNIGQEAAKYGIIPSEVDRFLEEASRLSPVTFSGLMTMPPLAADPEAVRPIFASLCALAADLTQKWQGRHQFTRLSMGTSNDFQVAVEEGATIIRIGGALFAPGPGDRPGKKG